MLTECMFNKEGKAERRGVLTTHLQADPVFGISLLAFRRGEHWRDRGGERKGKDDMCERKDCKNRERGEKVQVQKKEKGRIHGEVVFS